MIERSLPYTPTPEHRLTRDKWARRVGIIYGSILLLLLAFVAAQRTGAGHGLVTAIANGATAQPARVDLATRTPSASHAANPASQAGPN